MQNKGDAKWAKQIISMPCYCGHDCARCNTYIATQRNDDKLRKQSQRFYKETFGLDIALEEFNCEGGRSDNRFGLCRDCPFVKCCKEHHAASCGECPEYPCKEIFDYQIKYVNKSNQKERGREMKLIKLWEADLDRTYALQNSFPKEKNGFINEACGLSREEFKEYVQRREANSRGLQLPDGFVPSTVYILENEDGEYVGIFNFRHCLNDFLRNGPGHIGYGIGPKYRGRGYATEGLRLMLQIAEKEISEDEIFLSVHKDNPASLKVQLKNGAYIHGETETEYLTRIPRSGEHRSMGT